MRLVEPTPRDDVDIDAEDLAPSLRRLIDAATLRQQQQQRQEQQLLQPPPPAQYAQIHAKSPIAAPANSAGGGRRPSTTIPGGSGARGASSGARTGAPSPSPSPHSPLSPAGAAASSPSAGRPPAEALDVVRLQEQLRETAAARDRAYGQLKTMVSSVEALTAEHASLRERLRASQAAVDDNRRTAVEFSDRLEASEALRKREHETASMAAERLRLDAQSVRRDLAAAQKAAEAEAGRRREAESRMEKAAAAHQAEVAALRARVDDSVRDAAAARQERDKAIAALQVRPSAARSLPAETRLPILPPYACRFSARGRCAKPSRKHGSPSTRCSAPRRWPRPTQPRGARLSRTGAAALTLPTRPLRHGLRPSRRR